MEEWRDVVDYPGYKVSSFGNVIGKFGRQIKPWDNSRGYNTVWISNENGKKKATVHRLVADSFLPNPENKPTVNHKNHNRKDNTVENLEWATYSEQSVHSPGPVGKSGERNIFIIRNPLSNTYWVSIKRNKHIIFNNRFKTLQEAINARDAFKAQRNISPV